MAVDQFGNPLTEEERYRLMMEQQRLGLLPGLLGGPAVDTFSGMPFAAPSYGPFGGGIGQGAYQGTMGMGTPTILPGEETINITPVDPTLAGMGTVDPTGGLAATDPNLQGVTPTSTVSTGLYSEAGVPMSNENLSWFGAAPVPTSPSMNTVDYGPALQAIGVAIPPADLGVTTQPTTPSYPSDITPADSIIPVDDLGGNDSIDVQTQVDTFAGMPSDAGMAEVPEISVPESLRSRLLDDDGDLDTDQLDDIMHHLDMVFGTTYGPKGQRIYQDMIPGFPQGISKDFLKSLPQSLRDLALSVHDPVSVIEILAPHRSQDKVEQDIQDLVNNRVAQDLRNSGFDYQTALNSPNIATQDQVSAAAALARTGDIDLSESLPEMVSQVDTFKAVPKTTVTPRVSKAAQDKEKARMRALAAQQRKDELARQKAAAKEKRDTAKRVAALARQAAARQAQAAREVQASKDRVRQANAIMNSRAYQEGGIGNLSAAQRDVLAAAQVDTFAGISDPGQGVRDAMRSVGYGGPNWT